MKVELSAEQSELKNRIQSKLEEILHFLSLSREERQVQSYRHIEQVYDEMGIAAHSLYLSLNPKPKHLKKTVRLRKMTPGDPQFYQHIRPVQELLNYLNNQQANDEPCDQTLGETFYLNVFTRKWGKSDRYTLIRNEEGWLVRHSSQTEQGGRDAEPILSYVLRYDQVSYPRNLSTIMEDIWYRAAEEGLPCEKVQAMLNEVADWITMTEQNYPSHIALENEEKGYFS